MSGFVVTPADAHRLANRIKRHWDEWFTFLSNPEVKPDNNDAERGYKDSRQDWTTLNNMLFYRCRQIS